MVEKEQIGLLWHIVQRNLRPKVIYKYTHFNVCITVITVITAYRWIFGPQEISLVASKSFAHHAYAYYVLLPKILVVAGGR